MTKNKSKINQLLLWIGIVGILCVMTLLQVPMTVKNVFFVITTAICLGLLWKGNSESKWEIIILIIGLIARIVFCYLEACTEVELPIGGGSDGEGFFTTAVNYYHGDFSVKYTNYPYILWGLFYITGINLFAVQYINIVCWGFCANILQKCCEKLEISGILRLTGIAFMAWIPTNIWITSVLYRDTYVALFLFLSFYFLLCWMGNGEWKKIIFSIITILLASLLHGGSIVAIIPVVITVIFYSLERKRFTISTSNIALCVAVIAVALISLLVPQVRELIFRKIPFLQNGIIEGVNTFLRMKYDYSEGAGSNYLVGRYLNGYFDMIVMTIQRVYYHMFSPTPDMWRGLTDVIAFLGSTAPIYLVAMVLWVVSIFYKKFDAYRFVLFMEIAITVVLYAWANVNAGAALRHREKILGFIILMAIYSINTIIQKRAEKR